MKKYNLTVLYIFIAFNVVAQESDMAKANELYIEEHFKTAAKEYEILLDSTSMNAEVYYNLGNAYYKSNRNGLAIWAYERALKIDPRNEDAKFNLEFVQAQTIDKTESPQPAITEWLKRLLFGPHINFWAYISIASSLTLCLVALIFVLSKSRRIRNMSLLIGTTVGVVLIFSTSTAYFHKKSLLDDSFAIVVEDEINVKLSPINKSKNSFILHEGAKIHIEQQSEDWIQIEYKGMSGWTKEKYIKRI